MGHLSRSEVAALESFRNLLGQHIPGRVDRLVLFGSRARGEGREDSDLDVLVIVRDGTRADRRSVQDAAADVSLQCSLIVSPLSVSTADWPTHPLHATVDAEGKLISPS